MKQLTPVTGWLVIIGAINWGLVGLLDMNLVEMIFGMNSALTKVVYVLVGFSGLWMAYAMSMDKKKK